MYAYSLDRNDIQIKSEILPPPGIKVREMRGTKHFWNESSAMSNP